MAQENNEKEIQNNGKQIRMYVDGCWDVMHSGHYNALRQAKALIPNSILVVGVCSDEEISKNKREPIMKIEERMAAVRACKWVDEAVADVPYSVTPELLQREDVNCDYVCHGDDVCIDAVTGKSAYYLVEDKLKIFKRTPGISTTTLIQRLLKACQYEQQQQEQEQLQQQKKYKNHHNSNNGYQKKYEVEENNNHNEVEKVSSSWSNFLATSYRLAAFSNKKQPKDDEKILYIDGDFDLFHIGHIKILEECKQQGYFIYVGLYDDKTITEKKGPYYPFMCLQERVLTVLSCRYVDEIIMGCPYIINHDMIKVLNIGKIITSPNTTMKVKNVKEMEERYKIANELNILEHIEIKNYTLTTHDIMLRILKDQEKLQQQNIKRLNKEADYVQSRNYVSEA